MSQEKKNNAILIIYDDETGTCNVKSCFPPETTIQFLKDSIKAVRDLK